MTSRRAGPSRVAPTGPPRAATQAAASGAGRGGASRGIFNCRAAAAPHARLLKLFSVPRRVGRAKCDLSRIAANFYQTFYFQNEDNNGGAEPRSAGSQHAAGEGAAAGYAATLCFRPGQPRPREAQAGLNFYTSPPIPEGTRSGGRGPTAGIGVAYFEKACGRGSDCCCMSMPFRCTPCPGRCLQLALAMA